MDRGDGCTALGACSLKAPRTVYFEWVNCVIDELHLNKTVCFQC